jgi:hypothetical protein
MAIQEHEPLSSEPGLMSIEKRSFWAGLWPKQRHPKQPRLAVLQYAMNGTMRPTAPGESILYGYMTLNKFHDREPEAVLKVIEGLDSDFFAAYPRREDTILDDEFKKAVIGEAARAFFRHGLSAYGKPKLRKTADPIPAGSPLVTL